MANPKIEYALPDGTKRILDFVLPPVNKPYGHERTAVRHDQFSTSGLKQTMVERVESFLPLEMQWVFNDGVEGMDIAAWSAFVDFALLGYEFDYFPDSDLPAKSTYSLDDTSWKAEMAARGGVYKFKMRLRLAVAE